MPGMTPGRRKKLRAIRDSLYKSHTKTGTLSKSNPNNMRKNIARGLRVAKSMLLKGRR